MGQGESEQPRGRASQAAVPAKAGTQSETKSVPAGYDHGLQAGSVTYSHDPVGNRTGPGAWTYDNLNRMVRYGLGTDHRRLGYRGDGMRVWREPWWVPTGGTDSVGGGGGGLDDPNPYTAILSREVYKPVPNGREGYDGQMTSKVPAQSTVLQMNRMWTEGEQGAFSHTQHVPNARPCRLGSALDEPGA